MGGIIEEQWDRMLRWIGCPSVTVTVDSIVELFTSNRFLTTDQMQIITIFYVASLFITLLINKKLFRNKATSKRLSVDKHKQMLFEHQKLQFQKALISSTFQRNAFKSISSSSSSSQTDASSSIPATSTPSNKLKMKSMVTSEEEGKVPKSFCDICMDTKSPSEMFTNKTVCSHQYCSDCICRHVSAKIKENITKVKCPDPNCKGVIGPPEHCQSIVPKEVLERWEDALCESLILGTQKFYCPFKDCSAMLVDDSGEVVTSSKCPNCKRLFCAQCKVPWHSGMDCREYKSRKKDIEGNLEDMILMKLAKKKKWKRCPSCKFFVERNEGCLHITCRCGYEFCYGCGKTYDENHSYYHLS